MKNIKRKFFKEEIRKTFILYALTPIIILSFIFYNLLFWYSSKIIEKSNEKYNSSISKVISKEFLSYKTEVDDLVKWEEIKKVLYNQHGEAIIYEKLYNTVNKHNIRSVFYIFNGKGEVLITNDKGEPQYSKSDDLFMGGVFKKMKDNANKSVMMLNRAQLDVNTRTVYSIGKAITDDNNQVMGFIVFDILENELNKIVHSSTNHHAVITDRYNNNIVSTNNALLDGIGKLKPFLDKENNYVFSNPIIEGNIYIYTITYLDFIKNIYFIGEMFLILIFLILVFSMLFIAKKIAISKTISIDKLLSAIKSVQEGNLDTVVSISSNDEFQVIGQYCNEMIIKINELVEKNKEEARRNALSELKQLEAQFNPHFLFNTLEMLKYMIKIDEKSSTKIIVSMANLLRYSINTNFNKVKIVDDIKYIEDYLIIQKFRFEDNFDFLINLDEVAEKCLIPKLVIQPIIENSIKYGFETKEYLKINIDCRIEKNNLVISILDTGEGMSYEKLSELSKFMDKDENSTNHIGLYNVQKRINLMYGRSYGINIYSKLHEGTEIVINLPVHESEE
ncbi:sensor histidine kinase [Clostridium sp. CF012]|uniref:sensor histidine kinase n=1 Tax=Clostridium sp. CF012 TaxID=2843319 RepID=UPI001C0C12D5|nr:histidine kinase [Clostridium sp. CF012]MBU3143247.1 histidine kinase [Clostridium sp. CF012]